MKNNFNDWPEKIVELYIPVMGCVSGCIWHGFFLFLLLLIIRFQSPESKSKSKKMAFMKAKKHLKAFLSRHSDSILSNGESRDSLISRYMYNTILHFSHQSFSNSFFVLKIFLRQQYFISSGTYHWMSSTDGWIKREIIWQICLTSWIRSF